jgi:hypothetical protein
MPETPSEPPGSEISLRERLLIALCTDHGHLNQQGSLNCRTCNRRVDAILDVIVEHSAASENLPQVTG